MIGPSPKPQVPSTPDQRLQETSAFSPETPLEMRDSGHITIAHRPSFDAIDDLPDDNPREDDYSDKGSTNSDSLGSTVICQWKPESALEPPTPAVESEVIPTAAPRKPEASPKEDSITADKEQQKRWDHEWTIEQLELSVRDFPRNMLRLTSPVIMFLRANNEKALLRPFRQIFPDVAENILDGLCAVLIAKNWVTSIVTSPRKTSGPSQNRTLSRVDMVPEKALTTLGIHIPRPLPGNLQDGLRSRSSDLQIDLGKIVDNLLFAMNGRGDETLKSAVTVLAQVLESKA